MPALDFIKNIFAGGAGELANGIKGIIDVSKFSEEEKANLNAKIAEFTNAHVEKMAELTQAETEAYLKDTQSARDMNSSIQNSEKASWLAKNIAFCIDIFVMSLWGSLTFYLMFVMLNIIKKNENVDYTAVTAVWGAVGAYASTIINFHRGTSAGSKASGETMRELVKKRS